MSEQRENYLIKRFKLNGRHWVKARSDEDGKTNEEKTRGRGVRRGERGKTKMGGGGYDSFVID